MARIFKILAQDFQHFSMFNKKRSRRKSVKRRAPWSWGCVGNCCLFSDLQNPFFAVQEDDLRKGQKQALGSKCCVFYTGEKCSNFILFTIMPMVKS